MTDWYTLLTPLAVLLVLAFYRFVGCSSFGKAETTAPPGPGLPNLPPVQTPYADVVRQTAGVLGYWRLGESVDTPPTQATDQIGAPAGPHHGTYTSVPNGWNASNALHTAGAEGTYRLAGAKLRDGADAMGSVLFTGGYVLVPFAPALNTPQFTIEAWVRPSWARETKPTYHVVVESHAVQNGNHFGFILQAGPDPAKEDDPEGETFWQLRVGTGTPALETLLGPPVQFGERIHLVATCAGNALALWIDLGDDDGNPTSTRTLPSAFVPNPARPLYIGAGRTDATGNATPRFAFAGDIQDVSLHSRTLTAVEIVRHGAAGDGVL